MDEKIVVRNQFSISVLGILSVILITAKIFGIEPVAHWSWWMVLTPIWVPVVGFIAVGTLAFVALIVITVIKYAIRNS
jgi:hypothetical protein